MQVQTQQEVESIVNIWVEQQAPKNFSQTDHNARLILDFVLNNCGGYFSFSNLTRALTELGDISTGGVLQFHALPKSPQQLAREKRDFLSKMGIVVDANSWKADPAEQARKAKASIDTRHNAAQSRLDTRSRREIEACILGYSAYRDGKVSHALTEQRRNDLRKLAVHSNGKFDAGKTLALVREGIRRFPD